MQPSKRKEIGGISVDSSSTNIEMYYTACKFSDCAEFCMKAQQEKRNVPYLYTDTFIVNSAFSCEVFLKLLLRLEGIDYKKSHKLKDLFEKLPEEIQADIKSRTKEKCGYWLNVWGKEVLTQISNVFEKVRYIYENEWNKSSSIQIDMGYLGAFRESLKEECEKRLAREKK